MGVLSLGVRKGFKYRVGGSIIRVKEVLGPKEVVVTVDRDTDYTITEHERVQVIPDVFLSCGVPDHVVIHEHHSRLAIEAPNEIKIERIKDTSPRVHRGRAGEGSRSGDRS